MTADSMKAGRIEDVGMEGRARLCGHTGYRG